MGLFLNITVGLITGAFALYGLYWSYNQRNQLGSQRSGSSEPNTARCVVCLREFANFSKRVLLTCQHPIHVECAKLLFEQGQNSCPMCRQPIQQEVQERACHCSHEEQVEHHLCSQ